MFFFKRQKQQNYKNPLIINTIFFFIIISSTWIFNYLHNSINWIIPILNYLFQKIHYIKFFKEIHNSLIIMFITKNQSFCSYS